MHPTRRDLLVHGLRLGATLPLLSQLRAAEREREPGRVLVVVQLTGGNDGLNTVVPHRQDAYYRLRPTLALARGSLHALDDEHGLHPALGGLAELFAEEKLAVVHGVGLPEPDRSHFRALEIWHTASTAQPTPETGWLGRMADRIARAEPGVLPAIHVGASDLPLSLRAERVLPPSLRDADAFRLNADLERLAASRARILAGRGGDAELAFLRRAAAAASDAAARIAALEARSSPVTYPGGALARALRLVARLVCGDFGTRVFQLEHGGFDTHVQQARAHEALLGELGRALLAFQRDLEAHGADGRVLTLVFSEFGRRAAENGSRGSDHGAAAPAFVVGSAARGGLYGARPNLAQLVQGDVPASTDFRALYAALEGRWMGCPPSSDLAPLDVLRA